MLREFKSHNIYQGSLTKGTDIIEGLTSAMRQYQVGAGIISGIGAVTEARLAYYDQSAKKYQGKSFDEHMEIVSLRGNISFKDGNVFSHLHAVLSKSDYSVVGGHLLPKTLVFAFEFEIIPFEGKSFVRGFDQETGLFLWQE